MALKKLKQLNHFLLQQNFVDENKIASWMESGKLDPANKKMGASLLVCRCHYTAIFSIEGFTGNPDLLFVLVCTWLMINDTQRDDYELPAPDIDIDILDNDSADIEIQIEFKEDIHIVPSTTGTIEYDGQQWALGASEVHTVEEIAVNDNATRATDLPVSNT